jgi:hypothetical protein
MKQKIIILIVVLMAGYMVWFFLARSSSREKTGLPVLHPDTIVTSTAKNGTVRIDNRSAGYTVTIPRDWYLERSAGSGITLYPHYTGTDKTLPACKMEISVLQNADRKDLTDWLTIYLHGDPTVSVVEMSRVAMTADGATAIVWSGMLNDIGTMLAYVATGTVVYEIAPSAVLAANGISPSENCQDLLPDILKNFQLMK